MELRSCLNVEKKEFSVPYYQIVLSLIYIIIRIGSIAFNILLVVNYYSEGEIEYFTYTLICILVPIIITSILQVYMYKIDIKWGDGNMKKHILFLIVSFLLREYYSLKYGIISKKAENSGDKNVQKIYYDRKNSEDSDIAFIKIFECFLKLAPLTSLQLAIMIPFDNVKTTQTLATVIVSVGILAWCFSGYQRSVRLDQVDKALLSYTGTAVMCFWQLFFTISRILTIAILASLFAKWTLIACCVHAGFMTIWIFIEGSLISQNHNKCWNFLFSIAVGYVYIYNYMPTKEMRTRYRYLFFNTVCGLENLAAIVICFFYATDLYLKNYLILLIGVSYVLSIVCQIIYYLFFHPKLYC